MDSKQILSVGIDIGTSTSQLVFSRLELRNRAAACQVPRFEITDRRIIWQSCSALHAAHGRDTLDEAASKLLLIEAGTQEAGVRPEDVKRARSCDGREPQNRERPADLSRVWRTSRFCRGLSGPVSGIRHCGMGRGRCGAFRGAARYGLEHRHRRRDIQLRGIPCRSGH